MRNSPPAETPEPTHVPLALVRDVWRDALERGLEASVPVQGASMIPRLLPGDTIHTAKPADRPAVGEIVVYEAPNGTIIAHRVLAVGRRGNGWAVVTAGDRYPHTPDGVVTQDIVLARVTGRVRDGSLEPIEPVVPEALNRIRALWVLHTSGRDDLMARFLRGLREALRRPYRTLVYGTHDLIAAARGWPAIGAIVRLIWPNLADRCEVVTTEGGGDPAYPQTGIHVIWRGREAASVWVSQRPMQGDPVVRWWMDSAHTNRRYRRRGLMYRAFQAAFEYVSEHGAHELYALVRERNTGSRKLCEKSGYSVLEEGPVYEAVEQLNASPRVGDERYLTLWRRIEPPPGNGDGTSV